MSVQRRVAACAGECRWRVVLTGRAGQAEKGSAG